MKQESTARATWADYESLKAEWIKKHPDATSEEYQAATREIARRCGL